MHNLRGYLGDTLFRQDDHAHTALYDTAMTAQDFRDALEAGTGYDLTLLRCPGVPARLQRVRGAGRERDPNGANGTWN